jgi:hypothetical protein
MKPIRDIRRENLARLVRGYKSQRQFAKSVGLVPAHTSQLLSGTRDMGEDVARRIEDALGMPSGFLSLDPDVPPVVDPVLPALPADELKLLADYRRLSQKHRDTARVMLAALVALERA